MRVTTAVLILVGAGPMAEAQEAWVAGTTGYSKHALFSRPAGVAGGLTLPTRGRLAVRVTYSLLDDASSRFGRACAGLIPPEPACPEEPIDDATSLRGFTLGLVTGIKRSGSARVALIPAVSGVRMRTASLGRQTGNRLGASDVMIGLGGGAELTYRPSPTSPFAFHTGGQIIFLGRVGPHVVDGYTPFGGLALTRFDFGVSVGRRQQR